MTVLGPDVVGTAALTLLTIAIYLVIGTVFLNARRKYQGGVIEKVINLIIATIGCYLVADVALLLIPSYGFVIGYTAHVVFKIIAMVCLAIGGLKFLARR
jgi:hypothetical protein